jgi:membrane fusion protein (multidrug efflux system)
VSAQPLARFSSLRHALWLSAALGLALSACKAKAAAPTAPPPAEVTAITVMARDLPLPFEFPAQLQGSREVEVRARVSGIVLERVYREGEPVKAGQLLFRIDPAPYQAAADEERAALVEAQARQAQAERDEKRLQPLVEKRAVSRKEYDDAISQRESAVAAVESAKARLRSAQLDLGYTRVVSPIAGISGRALRSEGSLVNTTTDSLLTRVSQADPMWAIFSLSDREVHAVREAMVAQGMAEKEIGVDLFLPDGSKYAQAGTINFAGSLVDPQTGTVETRATFANPDGRLLTGQFVRVSLRGLVQKGALTVPQRAVQQGQQGKFVFVIGADDTVEARPIRPGDWQKEDWVVESGLQAGDRVVVDGAVKLRPGAKVKVAEAAPAEAAPPPAGK